MPNPPLILFKDTLEAGESIIQYLRPSILQPSSKTVHMATSVPVAADLSPANSIPPPGALKPGDGVQISTVEIKTQAKADVKPENLTNPTPTTAVTLPQGTARPPGNDNVSTAPKKASIPPGFKLIQKPLGDGTFSLVLRKMTPEELKAAGQTDDTSTAPKPATIASPPATLVTSSRSVTNSVPASPDKPDPIVAKSDSIPPSTSRSANIAAGATAIMGGLVMATESLSKMAEHGMKIHSSLTGQPLPTSSTPSAPATTPTPAAASKPTDTSTVAAPEIQSRMVVPTNVANPLAITPTAAAGLAALPTLLQTPLTQAAIPSIVGQPATGLSYYMSSAAANTTQAPVQSNAAHAGACSSDDVHPDAHNSDHAQGPVDDSGQEHDDTTSHDQHDDQSSPQGQGEDDHHDPEDGDNQHNTQDGDIPYEPQDGDIPYDPQEGDIPYEPEEGDIPYDLEEGDIPYDHEEGDIPYEFEEGDIPYDDQDDTPLEHENAAAPDEDTFNDQGDDAYCGGDVDEGYDMDDGPGDDFDHEEVNDESY